MRAGPGVLTPVHRPAAQGNGGLTILAEPNLTTVTGAAVSFLAGGEVPVLVPQGRYSVLQYKPFGVTLILTPTLIKNNRTTLHVHAEVSTISAVKKGNGTDAPDPATQRGDMTTELGSEQALAIRGLFQRQPNQTDDDADKVRLMGDTPVIGALFRSPRFQRGETELVIFVTPDLAKPGTAGRCAARRTGTPASATLSGRSRKTKSGAATRCANAR